MSILCKFPSFLRVPHRSLSLQWAPKYGHFHSSFRQKGNATPTYRNVLFFAEANMTTPADLVSGRDWPDEPAAWTPSLVVKIVETFIYIDIFMEFWRSLLGYDLNMETHGAFNLLQSFWGSGHQHIGQKLAWSVRVNQNCSGCDEVHSASCNEHKFRGD